MYKYRCTDMVRTRNEIVVDKSICRCASIAQYVNVANVMRLTFSRTLESNPRRRRRLSNEYRLEDERIKVGSSIEIRTTLNGCAFEDYINSRVSTKLRTISNTSESLRMSNSILKRTFSFRTIVSLRILFCNNDSWWDNCFFFFFS